MNHYIIRLDDACERMNTEKWNQVEQLLDHFSIKPLVGVIPNCQDKKMNIYTEDSLFWSKTIYSWMDKGWTIALHGYNHEYISSSGGINPVNSKSEFAGVPLEKQRIKIAKGIEKFKQVGIEPKVFFAPSHTFDENTMIALNEESDIKIISDTPAYDIYSYNGFTFVPQQFSYLRKSPYKTTTFCLHPNTLEEEAIGRMALFFEKEINHFISFPEQLSSRKFSFIDSCVNKIYFKRRGIKI